MNILVFFYYSDHLYARDSYIFVNKCKNKKKKKKNMVASKKVFQISAL